MPGTDPTSKPVSSRASLYLQSTSQNGRKTDSYHLRSRYENRYLDWATSPNCCMSSADSCPTHAQLLLSQQRNLDRLRKTECIREGLHTASIESCNLSCRPARIYHSFGIFLIVGYAEINAASYFLIRNTTKRIMRYK